VFQHICITTCLHIKDVAFNAARNYGAFQKSQDGQEIHKEGVVMVTFPPHYTQRLQPIDIAVLRPFKAK
jgi:hypothetical protein